MVPISAESAILQLVGIYRLGSRYQMAEFP